MPAPLLSVIMPVHNREAFVGGSIDSVLSQTLVDLELIVVDDASSDGTFRICSEWARKDARLVLIRQEGHIGVSGARNTGVLAAKGRYIAFVDDDDVLDLGYFEAMVDVALRDGVPVVCSGYDEFGDRDKHFRLCKGAFQGRLGDAGFSSALFFGRPDPNIADCLCPLFGAVWGKIFNAGLIKGSSGFSEHLPVHEDFYYLLRLASSSPGECVEYLPMGGYFHRVHSASAMSKPIQYTEERLETVIPALGEAMRCLDLSRDSHAALMRTVGAEVGRYAENGALLRFSDYRAREARALALASDCGLMGTANHKSVVGDLIRYVAMSFKKVPGLLSLSGKLSPERKLSESDGVHI